MYTACMQSRTRQHLLTCLIFCFAFSVVCLLSFVMGQPNVLHAQMLPLATCSTVQQIPQNECQALVALYNSTNGSGWYTKTGWTENNTPCVWFGVTCEEISSTQPITHVTKIVLPRNGLSGTLPAEIGDLSELQQLILYNTPLPSTQTGELSGVIPEKWKNLKKLEVLSLSYNRISGTLPSWLGDLDKLRSLQLWYNQFDGSIPPQLGNLSLLEELLLGYTNLSGAIPAELGNLIKLKALSLNSHIEGEIPERLHQLTQLTYLQIASDRDLAITLPWITDLQALNTLILQSPRLNGTLPPEIAKLQKLQRLIIKDGNLQGTLPIELAQLTNLIELRISNTQLSGNVSQSFIEALPTSLKILDLSNNLFSGRFPSGLGRLPELGELLLQNNQFKGEISPEFTNLSDTLNTLSIDRNLLTATDPNVRTLLGSLVPDWESTQTVPPLNQQVQATGETTTTLRWDRVAFSSGPGFMEISYSEQSATPITKTLRTSNKQDSTTTSSNLCPDTSYQFAIRTVTPGYNGQKSTLYSEFTQSLSVKTLARRVKVLNIYALALDSNLDKYYDEYVQSIAATTAENTEKIAIMLADRRGENNTKILVAQCGHITEISGLITSTEQTDPNLNEYDMTDIASIASFIRWARKTCGQLNPINVTCSQAKIIFSYIGHGVPLAPAVDIATLISPTLATHLIAKQVIRGLPPLPSKIPITPEQLTDQTSVKLISPYALSEMLRLATDNGANPIAVLDVVHCFSGSLEELYELSNPGGKAWADMIVASPNYAYAGSSMFNLAMLGVKAVQSSHDMAISIVDGYDAGLAEADTFDNAPDVDHPRVIFAVDSSKIPAIKETMDRLAKALLVEFGISFEQTKDHIFQTQQQSRKYDTTCDLPERKQDWELTSEDGLSDLMDFVQQLRKTFLQSSAVQESTDAVLLAVQAATVTTRQASGNPWFANNPSISWIFDERNKGIALYTDIVGITLITETQDITFAQNFIGWQAHFYTNTVSSDNPHPYKFLQGNVTWANVLLRIWESRGSNNFGTQTIACASELPQVIKRKTYMPLVAR